jgi:Fe-S-cluster-containing dehydrogenase component
MKKWNLIVDVAECHNCNNCFLACKDEYVGNDIPGYSAPQPARGANWIRIVTRERGRFPMVDVAHVPVMCNHCDQAPCVAAGGGAVRKREDGIVIIDPQRAVGRKDLVAACPYGAIWWNEELELPQAWIFDAHLLDRGWEAPRCVQVCPTGALKALKVSDQEMAAIVEAEQLRPLVPGHRTKPRVHYKNLHRHDRLFIAGAIVGEKAGVLDCVAQARVELLRGGTVQRFTTSDAFGEFKIDDLEANGGPVELRIAHEGFVPKSVGAELELESAVLGSIVLAPIGN